MNKFKIYIPIFDTKINFDINTKDDEDLLDNKWVTIQHISWDNHIKLQDSNDLDAVVHEIYHAVQHILKSRWVEDEETWAYFMWYITTNYKLKVDKILSKKKKK